MEILWLAILFYSVGLAAVLHFRPALMFNENGTWKEFGYHRAASARYTIFPFWLFSIVWAIISYTVAAAIIWAWRSSSVSSLTTTTAGLIASERAVRFAGLPPEMEDEDEEDDEEYDTNTYTPVSEMPMTETIRMRPSAKRIQTPVRQPRMGYYVLDPASEKSGLRRYVYYGNAPPPEVTAATPAPAQPGRQSGYLAPPGALPTAEPSQRNRKPLNIGQPVV